MRIQMEPHTLERALERGANEEEIIETLRKVRPVVAKSGRFGKVKAFQFMFGKANIMIKRKLPFIIW